MGKYDVFLCFNRENINNTTASFALDLHRALKNAHISVITDDHEKPNAGRDEIGKSLRKAIKRAKISLIVFSQNFPYCSVCLKELEQIVQARNYGQIVIPIFYNVDPSDIRKQRQNSDLETVANIKGYDSRVFRSDSELIKKIVEDVKQILGEIKIKKWRRRCAAVLGATVTAALIL